MAAKNSRLEHKKLFPQVFTWYKCPLCYFPARLLVTFNPILNPHRNDSVSHIIVPIVRYKIKYQKQLCIKFGIKNVYKCIEFSKNNKCICYYVLDSERIDGVLFSFVYL